ncbi:MAG: aminotransferase class I/II-fold pyridoxal phosphate-dependent enzyme, partial [Pseudomonadota bacterium]
LKLFKTVLDVVVAALKDCPGVTFPTPVVAFYVYPSIAGLMGKTSAGGRRLETDADFSAALLDEALVAVVHGAAFGLSPAFRVSYAASNEALTEACARIKTFCQALT